jgi:hypothetical protein
MTTVAVFAATRGILTHLSRCGPPTAATRAPTAPTSSSRCSRWSSSAASLAPAWRGFTFREYRREVHHALGAPAPSRRHDRRAAPRARGGGGNPDADGSHNFFRPIKYTGDILVAVLAVGGIWFYAIMLALIYVGRGTRWALSRPVAEVKLPRRVCEYCHTPECVKLRLTKGVWEKHIA